MGTGGYSSGVTWSVGPASIGTISSTGVFTPVIGGTATITATSSQDPTESGSTTVAVAAATGTLAISVIDLPKGANAAITVSGPGGYSAPVTSTQTLQNLAIGTYTITASSVHSGSYAYLPVLSSTTTAVSSSSAATVTVDYFNVLPDSTKILDAVGLDSLSIAADQSTLIVSGQSTVAQNLNPGDVLIISHCTAIPLGKVVRVTAVNSSSGWIVVLNSPASLMDAYQQYQLSASEQVDVTQIAGVNGANSALRVFRRPKPKGHDADNNQTTDACADQSALIYEPVNVAVTSAVTISGTVTICPAIQASLSWSWLHTPNAAHVEIDLGETADLTTTLSASVNLPQSELDLGSVIIPTTIPGVEPTLDFTVGAEGSASLNLSQELVQNGTGKVGFDFSNGVVTPIDSFSGNVSAIGQPQVSGNADITGYVKAKFGVDLGYGAIDPYVTVEPYAEAKVDTTQNPWWQILYGINGEVGIEGIAGDVAQALGFDPSWSAPLLGPLTAAQASGPFQPTRAVITAIGPPPLVSSQSAQLVAITGTSLANVTSVVLCATSGGCSSLSPMSVSATEVDIDPVLMPGSWTVMTQDPSGNSNGFQFAVYPPPNNLSIRSVQPALPSISGQSQSLSFTGSGFEQSAEIVVCFSSLCNEPVTAAVSTDGISASISSVLDHAGLWTAQLANPDGSQTAVFNFNVSGPLSVTVTPTGGTVNVTSFQARGSGATPGKTVAMQLTSPGGQATTINLTADSNGVFAYGPFSEASAGAYTLLFTDRNTGETSAPSTVVLSNGINGQVYPSSGAIYVTSFTVSGWGATPGGSAVLTVLTPSSNLISQTTTASSSGNFSFQPVAATQVGTYFAVCEDHTTSAQSGSIIFNATAAAAIAASISPQSGIVNTTVFTISGTGATSNSGVTAHITSPGGAQLYHAQAANGAFSFSNFYESAAGNYTVYVSDDATGSQSSIVGWIVNPDQSTHLETMSVLPAAWGPVFATGSTTLAVMPLTISGGGNGVLTGTISSSQPWLLVDGHSSETWTAPESIALNANPTGLSAGTHTATLTITSPQATNSPISLPVTAIVRAPLQLVTTSIPDVLGGNAYSASLVASGGTGSGYKWSLVSGYLPYGLSLDPVSGTISGTTVAISSTQNLTFSMQVEDSSGADATGIVAVTYRPGLFVQMYSPSNFDFIVGTSYNSSDSIVIPTTGGQGLVTLAAIGMPSGLNLNSSTGLISGTPSKPGSYPVSFYAQDSSGDKANATFTLLVSEIPLSITTVSLPSASIGSPYQQYIAAQGGSQAGYSWTLQGSLPPGLQGTASTGCTACDFGILGTPTAQGTYNFTVSLQDSLGNTASKSYTLYVGTAPPQIQTAMLTLATVGTAYSFQFNAVGGTSPYMWTFVGSSPDPGLQLSIPGTLSGTPTIASTCPTGPSSAWYGAVPAVNFTVKVTDANNEYAMQQLCMGTYYATPSVISISPNVIVADGTTHTVTITGTSFMPNSEVLVGGGSQAKDQYVDAGHVTISLVPSQNALFAIDSASGGQVTFIDSYQQTWIVQPAANYSNQNLGFTIADPTPTIANISAVLDNSNSPCTANVLCQLVIAGTGFVFDTQYQISSPTTTLQAATWPSTTLPWASVTTSAFSMPSAGTYTVIVTNPNQAGGGTATVKAQFSVQP